VPKPEQDVTFVVRWLDKVAIVFVKLLIVLTHLKSRDPSRNVLNLFRSDPTQQVHIRDRTGMLEWSPQKRVGCMVGVLIGLAIGGVIFWYGLK